MMLVIGIVLPFTGIFVPSRVPFFITRAHAHEASVQQQDDEQKGDTVKRKKPRYSVRRTTTETTEDVKHRSSDLQDPDNLKTEVTYDEKDGTYQVGTVLVGTENGKRKTENGKRKTENGTDAKPSAEIACKLCRGAKEVKRSDKPPFSKGRFGGNVNITG